MIGDLGDLKATTAYEAIRRAFEQNRVDPEVSALEIVERAFGMRPRSISARWQSRPRIPAYGWPCAAKPAEEER